MLLRKIGGQSTPNGKRMTRSELVRRQSASTLCIIVSFTGSHRAIKSHSHYFYFHMNDTCPKLNLNRLLSLLRAPKESTDHTHLKRSVQNVSHYQLGECESHCFMQKNLHAIHRIK